MLDGLHQRTPPAAQRTDAPSPAPTGRLVVAHVFGAMDLGGAELRTLEVMARLPEVEPLYITLSGRAGVLEARIQARGGRVVPLRLTFTFPWSFVRALRQGDVRVVHSHVATFTGFVLLLARLAGVPRRVAHFRSDGDGRGMHVRRRLQRGFGRMLIRSSATDILGVTPSALSCGYRADWLRDSRCRVVPNGFDEQRIAGAVPRARPARRRADTDDLVIMHVGRPSPEKNRLRLVRVLRSTCDLGEPARLVLVGPRDRDEDLRLLSAAEAAGVADRVTFHGPSDDVPALLERADVLVLPSIREGLPGVALEARAVGTPVVGSDLPGLRYLQAHLDGFYLRKLTDDDGMWALDVQAASRAGRPTRGEALARLAGSHFSMLSAVEAHRTVYGVAAPA